MQLIFNNLAELNEMIAELGYVHCMDLARIHQIAAQHAPEVKAAIQQGLESALLSTELVAHSDEGFTGPVGDAFRELAQLGTKAVVNSAPARTVAEYGPQHGTEPDAPKRKRRTKAEMEAARAEPATEPPAADPLDNLKPEAPVVEAADTDDMKAAIADMAGLYDGSDALAQLDEGRKFIASHGFPAYNETMHVVGVPSNIAAHTPEQRSLHRAAMAYMAARKG
jgi:hypothetical protein